MAIEFTHLVGDWRRIVEDYVTDPENNADAPGVEGTITVSPILGEGRHAPRGVPSGGVFYTFAPLDLRVYRGLLMDENMNSDITVAIEVDGYPIAWRAKFDLQYRRIKIPLQDVIFGPDEIVAGQISLSSLVARDGVPPEYEGSYVQLMDAVAQAAGHAATAGTAAALIEANLPAINAAPGHAQRAEDAANAFGLTATTTTGAPGSDAAVTVSGDGPAYTLGFTVPRGAKGDKGDTGTTEWSGITGKPSTFPPSTHTHADKADLVGGQVPTSQLPAVALSKPFPVADRAGMLALAAEEGDVAVVATGADKGTYMLSSGPATAFSSWVKLTTPDAPVQSVNGQTGTVNLNAANVGARPSSYVPAWSEVTSKPATFPPTIGTTAATAKAGNYVPAWSEVTGKPATFPPAAHTHTAADVGAVTRQGAATGLWIGTEATLPSTGTAGVLYVTY